MRRNRRPLWGTEWRPEYCASISDHQLNAERKQFYAKWHRLILIGKLRQIDVSCYRVNWIVGHPTRPVFVTREVPVSDSTLIADPQAERQRPASSM